MNTTVRKLLEDCRDSLSCWRLWLALGWNDVATQYRRSFLGPVWISLSTGVFVLAFGALGSKIFRFDVEVFLPWFAIGNVYFNFIAAVVIDSCDVFIRAESYLKHRATPRMIFVFQLLTRNAILLAHNLLVVIGVLLWFSRLGSVDVPGLILGFLLFLIAAAPVGALIGGVCARFRDIPVLIKAIMPVMFFLTPIVWFPNLLPADLAWVVAFNPLAVFVDLVRAPALGQPLADGTIVFALLFIGGVTLLFLATFRSMRPRIVYWL